MLKALQVLAVTCVGGSATARSAPPEEALAHSTNTPPRSPKFAAFLRHSPPANCPRSPGLPAELRQWLEESAQPIRDAPRG